jgi:hypothetical protein
VIDILVDTHDVSFSEPSLKNKELQRLAKTLVFHLLQLMQLCTHQGSVPDEEPEKYAP